MKIEVIGTVDEKIVEFFRKMEQVEESDSPQLFLTDSYEESRPFQVVFSNQNAEFYSKGELLARFEQATENYPAIWAFAKSYVDKEGTRSGLTSTKWARRIVSGILKAMVVLLEVEDKNGFSHSQRVTKLAQKMGVSLGLSEKEQALLIEASMLHDVGKIGIEQLMMFTPTRIRFLEDMPRDHTIMGSIYLSTIEFLWDLVPIVRSHHEWWDGRGYPDGLKGEEIPFFARIIAICDYYDELTHFVTSEWGIGPKKKDEALKMISNQSGKMLDPALVELFVRIMESDQDV
ncbi:MAG TPA: HD domain-containing protein [Pseudothermotoga sp.]|nr:HD domain-containing protein [Pseudothermotoga sp.]HPP70129.1 HD domain-containing protein [Pseudothermotoga sp.]